MAWWVTELGEGLNTPLTDLSVKKVYYRRVPSKVLSGFPTPILRRLRAEHWTSIVILSGFRVIGSLKSDFDF